MQSLGETTATSLGPGSSTILSTLPPRIKSLLNSNAILCNSLGFSLLFLTVFSFAGGAALSILLGICLRCCLSKKEAAGGGTGGGSAGANENEPTYTSKPFLLNLARNKEITRKAYQLAQDDPNHAHKLIPAALEEPADIFEGSALAALDATVKVFGKQ